MFLLNWAASWKLVFVWWGQADKGFLVAGLFLVPRAQWGTVPSSVKSPFARSSLLSPVSFACSPRGTRQPFGPLAWSCSNLPWPQRARLRGFSQCLCRGLSDLEGCCLWESLNLSSRGRPRGGSSAAPLTRRPGSILVPRPQPLLVHPRPVSPMPALPSSSLARGYCPGPGEAGGAFSIHRAPPHRQCHLQQLHILALRPFSGGIVPIPGTPGAQGFLREWGAGEQELEAETRCSCARGVAPLLLLETKSKAEAHHEDHTRHFKVLCPLHPHNPHWSRHQQALFY